MRSNKNTYQLINPLITGQLNTVVHSKNSFNASKKLYKSLSKYVNNHVDTFYMSVKNVVNGKLSHFSINESQSGGNIKYSISKLPGNFSEKTEKKLIDAVEQEYNDQKGGSKKRDLLLISSDSDSSSDFSSDSESYLYDIPVYPVSNLVYFHLPYTQLYTFGMSPLDRNRLSIPMFSFPNNPTMDIRLDFYTYTPI